MTEQDQPARVGRAADVRVGIDAGGSSTRACAVKEGKVVFTGAGGPANPTVGTDSTVRASFTTALDGCPAPTQIYASVAGAGSVGTQQRIGAMLTDLFPAAEVTVVPDYVAAFLACPPPTDLCVIAGTGSVICSPAVGSSWNFTGGRGWILGDEGSAAWLGQRLLAWYADDPHATTPQLRQAVRQTFGTEDWRMLAKSLQTSSYPARLLASAAPILTGLAAAGHIQATAILNDGMNRLACLTARHITAHLADDDHPQVGLVGGVWSSSATVAAFVSALRCHAPHARVDVEGVPILPMDGLIRQFRKPR